MRLSRIDIRRLGQIRDLSIEPLSPQLTVVYGPNEAGKSTVRDAIRYALFGFPATKPGKDTVDTRPYGGVDREVALRFVGDGTELHLARMAEGRRATAGECTISPASAQQVFADLTAGVDDRQYHTMWNVSLANLAGIDPSRDSGKVLSALLAAEHGTAVSPSAAIAQLDGELNRIFSPAARQSGPSMKTATDEVIRLRDELSGARRDAAGIATLRGELAELEAQLDVAEANRRKARVLQHTTTTALADLDRLTIRAHEVEAQLMLAEERYREALEQSNAADSPELQRVLEVARAVHALEAERALAEDKRLDANRIADEIEDLRAKMARYDSVPDVLDAAESEALLIGLERLERQVARTAEDLAVARAQVDAERTRSEAESGSSAAPSGSLAPTRAVLVLGVVATIAALVFTSDILFSGGLAFAFALVVGYLYFMSSPHAKSPKTGLAADPRLAGAIAALATRERAAEEARTAWGNYVATQPPISEHAVMVPEELIALVKQASTKADLATHLSAQTRQLARALSIYREWVERTDSVTEEAKGPNATERPTLQQLSTLVHEAEQLATKASHAGETLPHAAQALEAAGQARASHEAELAELLEKYRAQSVAEAAVILADLSENTDARIEESDSLVGELGGRRGEIIEAIRTAESSHGIERLAADLESANERLAGLTKNYVITLLAKTILGRGVEHFAGQGRPTVMDSASGVFASLTGGAYVGVEAPEDGGEDLNVVAADGARKSVAQLSVGTVEQLYLAIRFGALLALPTRGRDLPVLLDEVLANYDETRSEYAYDAIATLAEARQVVYFTCQEDVATGLADAATQRGVNYVRVSIDGGRLAE